MDRAETTLPEEIGPIFLGVLIVDAILEVVRKKVFQFDGRGEANPHVRIDTNNW